MTHTEPVRRWVFGSAESCELRILNDQYVSARHALATRDGDGQVWLADLGSTNGTRVERDGELIRISSPTRIYPGDVVVVGRTRLPWRKRS